MSAQEGGCPISAQKIDFEGNLYHIASHKKIWVQERNLFGIERGMRGPQKYFWIAVAMVAA
jgi:hypothetical protein